MLVELIHGYKFPSPSTTKFFEQTKPFRLQTYGLAQPSAAQTSFGQSSIGHP